MPVVFSIFVQGLRYSHFLNWRLLPCWLTENEKMAISQPGAKIEKTKGTLFSQTLKVEGNKVPLVFAILAQGLRYSLFLIFCQPRQQGAITKFRKGLYLGL